MEGFWKLIKRTSNYRSNVILGIVFNILLSIFTVISIPLIIPFFQLLFDRVPSYGNGVNDIEAMDGVTRWFSALINNAGKENALIIVCSLIIVVFLFKNLFRYLATFVLAPMRTGIVYDMRSELYNKFLFLPIDNIEAHKSGDYISRISADIQEVEHSILKLIQVVVKAPLIIIGSVVYMLYLSSQLSIFVFGLLIFTIVVIGGISKSLKKKSTVAQRKLSNIVSQVEETISGNRIIKSFNAQHHMQRRFDVDNFDYKNTITSLIRRQDLSSPLSEWLGVSIVAILMFYGAHMVFKGNLLPETFFAFIFAFYQVIEPSKSFSTAYYNIQKGLAALDRVDHITGIESESSLYEGIKKSHFTDEIVFNQVSFAYESGHDVLHDISFNIKKGDTVALVGSSGSGKSTLMDLILGFYPVSRGSICIDGLDISKMNKKDLRSMLGLVSQNSVLFNDTVKNNISFANNDVSEEQIFQSAKMSFAHEFIQQLPKGYDSNIGDKGLKLSGGQKQRLTIARAILTDPDILLLDEATSALDSESEKYVQEALENITKERTAIVIAHRLSTIVNADKILVMDQGKIIARGTHEYLLNVSDLYKKYVEMQSFR